MVESSATEKSSLTLKATHGVAFDTRVATPKQLDETQIIVPGPIPIRLAIVTLSQYAEVRVQTCRCLRTIGRGF